MSAEAAGLTVRARSLATPLADLRTGTPGGRVLATFERSAYLDLDGRIVTLAAADVPRGPFVITLDEFAAVREACKSGRATTGDGVLRVGFVAIDLWSASVWDPTLPRLHGDAASGTAAGRAAREAALDELRTSAPPESVVALLDVNPLRGSLLTPLSRGLASVARFLADPEAAADARRAVADEIAGRGPGLTPSGDDLLMGILLALTIWPDLAVQAAAARDLLVEAALPHTTRISGAYLDAARRGWAAEPWHRLVRSLAEPPAATREAVRRIARIGETSGADALTGFCWAWRRLDA